MKPIRFFAIALAASAILNGCDRVAPENTLAPNLSKHVASKELRVVSGAAKRGSGGASAIIDQKGGSIAVGNHSLTVPANAVSEPTRFSMDIGASGTEYVQLRAWRVRDGAAVTQFPVDVELNLDVSGIRGVNFHELVVVYLVDGTYTGPKEVVRTSYNEATKVITGYLNHFSIYAVARELIIAVD